VAQIDLVGIKEFDAEVDAAHAARRRPVRRPHLRPSDLDFAEQELKRQYLSRGRYAAEVQTTVTPLERNRVGITVAVNEGDVAKIRAINIVGSAGLRRKDCWWTSSRSARRLAHLVHQGRPVLQGETRRRPETLRSFYQDRGYVDFAIESTQVSITPTSGHLHHHQHHRGREVHAVGRQARRPDAGAARGLQKWMRVKPGEVFSPPAHHRNHQGDIGPARQRGLCLRQRQRHPADRQDKRTVALTIVIDPGRRVYVRRINVAGNTKTRDEVVRREMRQLEGSYYDASKIQLSKTRIDRTQYFKDVSVETTPVAESADQVDVNFTVEEKPTGAMLFGAGFSPVDKFVLSGLVCAVERLRQRQVRVGAAQHRQGEPGRRCPTSIRTSPWTAVAGLRLVQARRRRVQPRDRRLQDRRLGRGRQVQLSAERIRLRRLRGGRRERQARAVRQQPLFYKNFAASFGNHTPTPRQRSAGRANAGTAR
jgi:outer membrane protein insertion porin family